MKTTSIILATFLLSLFVSTAFAQTTQDILDKARENESNRSGGGGSSRSSDGGGGGDGDGFFLLIEGIGYIFKGIAVAQVAAIESERENEIHRITSLELSGQYGALPSNYQIAQGKLRGNWGIFSMENRYYHQSENRVGNSALYNTFDLQLLQLNLPLEHVNFRLGIGNLHEYATRSDYTERTLALDIYPTDRLRFGVEGRWARDSDTGTQVRREWNANGYYRLGKSYTRCNFHAHISAMHARYYESVEVWSISAGLSMRVE